MSEQTLHGDWVRWLYFAKHLRIGDVAQRIEVSGAVVGMWMKGTRQPTDHHKRALIKLCGVSIRQYDKGPRMDKHAVVQVGA